jgi:hypothetical protein
MSYKHSLGDRPIESAYRRKMDALARAVDNLFNGPPSPDRVKRVGFILMVFPFEGGGRCNYVSNADRADVIVLLKEQLARFEGQPDVAGHA